MQRERKAKNFLPTPVYPGGPKAMGAFISEQMTYPKEAIKNKIEGTVALRLDIDYKGNVVGSHVKSGLRHGCNEEAQRIVSLLKFEIDGQYRRGKILFHKNINIHFRLPKPKKTSTRLNYRITKMEPAQQAKQSYNYTITLPD